MEIGELANNPMGYLLEAVHSAGFSGALASPLYAPESAITGLTGDVLEQFVSVRPLLRSSSVFRVVGFLVSLSWCFWMSGELHCSTYGISS